MILLQAAIPGSFMIAICLGVFLLVGVPILTSVLMNLYGRLAGKKEKAKSGKAYYKSVIPFVSIIVFSIMSLLLLFYLLIILFDEAVPSYGFSN